MTTEHQLLFAVAKPAMPQTSRQIAERMDINYERNFNKREARYAKRSTDDDAHRQEGGAFQVDVGQENHSKSVRQPGTGCQRVGVKMQFNRTSCGSSGTPATS